jgi:hypothetical protein
MKRCPDCERTLPLDGFYQLGSGKPSSYCRECSKAQARAASKRKRKFATLAEARAAAAAAIRGRPRSTETKAKISSAHRRSGHQPPIGAWEKSMEGRGAREQSPSWKGGISLTNGYRCRYEPHHPRAHPNGYVYEHILVAERVLGRALAAGEVVHHIDFDKLNNAPENLHVCASHAEHMEFHRGARAL